MISIKKKINYNILKFFKLNNLLGISFILFPLKTL